MSKNLHDSILKSLRESRGITKSGLVELSGVSDFTIRRIEGGMPGRGQTWTALLRALASVQPLSDLEIGALCDHLGWSRSVIAQANSVSPAPADLGRRSPEARVLRVIRSNPTDADRLAGFLEAAARLLHS